MNPDDTIFWDRLHDMPPLEAEMECVLRREQNCLQLAMLQREQIEVKRVERGGWHIEAARLAAAATEVMAELTKLNERIRELRQLQHRTSWRNAVAAVYGQDGVAACLVWMEQNGQLPGATAC